MDSMTMVRLGVHAVGCGGADGVDNLLGLCVSDLTEDV